MAEADPSALPGHACQLFQADDVFVAQGANLGDGLTAPDQVCLGDVYQLDGQARALRLIVTRPQGGGQSVAAGSQIGTPGEAVRLEARLQLMAPDGDKIELLVLNLASGARFALPLSPIGARVDYTLIAVEPAPGDLVLADLLCLSFARGTMITLASGAQKAIESLMPGDKLLTRDHGPQAIRWIGHARLRAVGPFAPVVITAGTLGNAGDLLVSQHHRMFLYQRERRAGLKTAELLVQARHLVDDDHVFLREGGFVDYFSLIFDRHEIIYAEGIPAESLLVNDATINSLPSELAEDVKQRFPGLAHAPHFGTEAGRQFLDELGPKALFQPPRRPRGT